MSETFHHGYALLIGVGQCAYPPWSLPVTVKDVQALHTILVDPTLCAYPDDQGHMRVLHDDKATHRTILEGLAWLQTQADADPDATVLFYYSGHGWLDRETGHYYLIPHDVRPYDILGSALPAHKLTDALRQISAKRLLVFIDSCHAEGMATAKDEPSAQLPPNFVDTSAPQQLLDQLKQGEGRVVFTSSRGSQKSWVRPDNRLSIYTYHLVEALQGAGNQPGDTTVRVSNVMNYLGKSVPASAQQLCHAEQTPFFDTLTEDFSVALLRGGKGLPLGGWNPEQQTTDQHARYIAHVANSGVVAQGGSENLAVGQGGVAIKGDVKESFIITGSGNVVNKP